MKRKNNFIMAVVCMIVFVLGGCVGGGGSESAKPTHTRNIPAAVVDEETDTGIGEHGNTEAYPQYGTEVQTDIEGSAQAEAGNQSQSSDNPDGTLTDAELEEELARYRQEREDNIQEVNGLVEGGSPDESNYTFDLSGIGLSQFDTREVTEGFAAARIFVTDTLGMNPSTKMEVYMCVDPRILSIYEDEDKGVAAGYDNSNIFVCEYCSESNVWQYLILVREGKGSPWKVIHNGSGYKSA